MIRLMRPVDLEAVAKLEAASILDPWSKASFAEALPKDYTLFLVCDQEEEICGYIGMYLTGESAEITGIAADPNRRRQQIGSRLLAQAADLARQRKMTEIVLEVRISNAGAISFYKKHGFRELGTRKRFYVNPVEDALIMQLPLLEEGNP